MNQIWKKRAWFVDNGKSVKQVSNKIDQKNGYSALLFLHKFCLNFKKVFVFHHFSEYDWNYY